jgi:hypothetical protein
MTRRVDRQQQATYRWESEWKAWNTSTATLPELRTVIRWALKRYGLKTMPAVKQHEGGKYAWSLVPADGSRPVISFQKKTSKNAATALHEIAHQICEAIFPGDKVQDHGVEFLGIYMALLTDAGVIPVEALHATALKHKLKWLPYSEVGPAALRSKR